MAVYVLGVCVCVGGGGGGGVVRASVHYYVAVAVTNG